MLADLLLTAAAVAFAALVFVTLFRYLKPEIVVVDYHPCRGGWHEAVLEGCETGLLRVPQQPINTYSNLAYLAAGVYVDLQLDTGPSFVFAVTMTYLCIGSALYHATSTRWAGMLDVTAIYTVFSALAVYSVAGLLGDPAGWVTSASMLVVAGLATYYLSSRFRRRMNLVIGIFLGTAYLFLLIDMLVEGDFSAWPLLAGSVALLGLAFLIWNMDKAKTFPLKRWGHGLWHVFTAAASALVFYAAHLTP